MTEILTESFCERCGTRYTFESAAPRKSRLGRVRVVSKGLRNFVMQDESTLSEAMADARSDVERAATAHQLDAFHKTFNFCMSCRQYTCGNCWNTVEGRCLTCSPVPGMELPEPAGVDARPEIDLEDAVVATADLSPEAWPEADLGPERLARAMGLAGVAAAGDADVEAEPEEEPEEAAATAPPQVIGLAPGQSLEDALAAYEAQEAAAELAATGTGADASGAAEPSEPGAAAEVLAPQPEPEPVAAEAGVVVAEALVAEAALAEAREPEEPRPDVETETELPAADAAPEPVLEAEPEAGTPAHDDIVEQPAWPAAAAAAQVLPDVTPPAPPAPEPVANPWLTVAPDDGAAPQWPTAPQWGRTASGRETPTTLAGRPLLPLDNAADLWAASAREVLSGGAAPAGPVAASAPAPVTPQPCVSCGLSLSANARFCRRCGTRQG